MRTFSAGLLNPKYHTRARTGGEIGGRSKTARPQDDSIIGNNRPMPALPQGYTAFLEQKFNLFFVGAPRAAVLVTRSPIAEFQLGRGAVKRTKPVEVQFIFHCNTRFTRPLFLYHLQHDTA